MKNFQINDTTIGTQSYNLVEKLTGDGVNVYNKSPYPSQGLFLLDENTNVLDKNAESYPEGTIKAFGFKASNGVYYAIGADNLPSASYGSRELIEGVSSITSRDEAYTYYGVNNDGGEQDTLLAYEQIKYEYGPYRYAMNQTLAGKSGFLPSTGIYWDIIMNFRFELAEIISKFGLDTFDINEGRWTSTQYDKDYQWITVAHGENTLGAIGWVTKTSSYNRSRACWRL